MEAIGEKTIFTDHLSGAVSARVPVLQSPPLGQGSLVAAHRYRNHCGFPSNVSLRASPARAS